MPRFLDVQPTAANQWRAIVLFGRNAATYKFALGRALLELAGRDDDLVPVEELAAPYARHLCAHLREAPKQGTSARSKFLDACREHGGARQDDVGSDAIGQQLLDATVRYGFVNVLGAFHHVGNADLPTRFFLDERISSGGIRLTDELRALAASGDGAPLAGETEARWRLVETAWELGLDRAAIDFDPEAGALTVASSGKRRRRKVTSARAALRGYQKGRCFYCFGPMTSEADPSDPAPAMSDTCEAGIDVDHFFAWSLAPRLARGVNIDGVWNLVLACQACNRGEGGKFAAVPSLLLLERLHARNEFLIGSHHPLRETLIAQTGGRTSERQSFLQAVFAEAVTAVGLAGWHPEPRGASVF